MKVALLFSRALDTVVANRFRHRTNNWPCPWVVRFLHILTPHPGPLPVEGRGGAASGFGCLPASRRPRSHWVCRHSEYKGRGRWDAARVFKLRQVSAAIPSPLNGLRAQPRRETSSSLARVRGEAVRRYDLAPRIGIASGVLIFNLWFKGTMHNAMEEACP
jgi:hypothetical protein